MVRRVLALAAASASWAGAWNQAGHELVAEIAMRYMTPAAKARAAAILGPDASLVSIAAWADQVRNNRRNTGPWHYVNIPISRPGLDRKRDCPSGKCVIGVIEDMERALIDPGAAGPKRREALMFLVHFVGDLHQPLHSSDNGDKGGNNVPVTWFGSPMNLHSVWDGALLERFGSREDLLAILLRDLNPKRARKWGRGTPEQWAGEAHSVAKKVAYGRLPHMRKGETARLDDSYARKAMPAARVQLQKAGVRLAAELNRLLQ